MSRIITFILIVSSLSSLSERAASSGTAQVAETRPNILFAVADDWSFPHAGVYGDRAVTTPNFDRIAREGALFLNAFTAAPSCTPSRAALLTGQAVHRLAEGGNLHGFLPERFAVYPDILEGAGYHVGFTGKGWGPGQLRARRAFAQSGRTAVQAVRRIPGEAPRPGSRLPSGSAATIPIGRTKRAPARRRACAPTGRRARDFFPTRRKCAPMCSTTSLKCNGSTRRLPPSSRRSRKPASSTTPSWW